MHRQLTHLTIRIALAALLVSCSDPVAPPPPPVTDSGTRDASGDAAEDTAEDTSADASADASEDTASEDTSADTSADASEDTSEDTAPAGPRVLFVGNSYTFYNDLPRVVQAIAAASGLALDVDAAAIGGAQLMTHWESDSRNRVMTGGYDYVVMQGQSVEPVLARAGFLMHAELFADAIDAAGSEGVWFATWARREGHEIYSATSLTPETMAAGLLSGYREAAAHHDDILADVGSAWTMALATVPEAELFDLDGSHPAPAGTLLAACVITRALISGPPTLPEALPGGIDRGVAERLCAIGP